MKILVIRRDNIGDLVCTTPLLRSLRQQLPDSRIEVLVTSYNKAVVEHNKDIDSLHFYTKAKHRTEADGSLPAMLWHRLKTVLALRRCKFDWILLPGGQSASAERFARWIRGARTVSSVALDQSAYPHEVEQSCRLLSQLGLQFDTPAPVVLPDPQAVARLQSALRIEPGRHVVALHVSARKPSQRWSAEKFVALAKQISEREKVSFVLLWSPGSSDNPRHPGDDEKAAAILSAGAGLPIKPVPTHELDELIAALALCSVMICADGGAMHLAAGLGKPIVCLFGKSNAERWHPWGVPYELLQTPCQEVDEISVDDVYGAYRRLMMRLPDCVQAEGSD